MNSNTMFLSDRAVVGMSGFFTAYGSFGIVDARDTDMEKIQKTDNGFCADYDTFTAICECTEQEHGVYVRRDRLLSKVKGLTLNGYYSRFALEGGDYEVYTQYSNWQHESIGGWQALVTGVEISNRGIRTTDGATPMVAIRNKGNGKTVVFHLVPNAQWKIRVSRYPMDAGNDGVLIEMGINNKGLHLVCDENEIIEMPEILFYNTENRLDLDAWKLHAVYNTLYPRRRSPVLYNTWMCRFDRVTVDDVCRQADCAAALGVEIFTVDAGWFGESAAWGENIGIWKENQHTGFRGELRKVADHVKRNGLIFGLWLEPERALANTAVVKAHPDYFIRGNDGNCFLNFANPDAQNYILNVVCDLVDTYGLGAMKFDFNASLSYDITGNGFYRYFKGQDAFIRELRHRYPHLYLTNCASGGTRMDLGSQKLFDSIWMSDNQSPIDGVRIFKETVLRMPPSNIEKWDVRVHRDLPVYEGIKPHVPLSCDNATYSSLVTVSDTYTHAFITGGVMGFSADIAAYPDEEKRALKAWIAAYKSNREFYKNAVLRILHDSDTITVFQYSDVALSKIVIHAFFKKPFQETLTVYPVVNRDSTYHLDGSPVLGTTLAQDGFTVSVNENDCVITEIYEEGADIG